MIIGLVGKSCSGKNCVAQVLEEKGILVWDLDVMCHEGLVENAPAVREAFGDEAVSVSDGKVTVSRSAIGKVVFSDPSKRAALELILYPWLEGKIRQWDSDNPGGVLVINGALLYRAGFHRLCSAVIYVDAPYETRLSRAMKRDGITEEAFSLREKSQTDVDYRDVDYGVPVYVVTNDEFNFDKLNRQVFIICDRLGILKM